MSERTPELFIPGPTEVRPDVLEACATPMIGHRTRDCADLVGRIADRLKQMLTPPGEVVLLGASANGAMEASLRNLVRPGKRVLCCVSGAWGQRFADIADALQQDLITLEVDPGEAIKPDQVAATLDAVPDIDCVTIVMNDTSTGVIQPVQAIAEVVKQDPERMMVVDAVSAMAAEVIDVAGWGLDVCLAGLQKAFACPPGLTVMTVSPAALERAPQVPHRGLYFDFVKLVASAAKRQTLSTPPLPQLFALDRQLDHILAEGMEARRARHVEMAELTRGWALERFGDDALFAEEGHRSITLTCVRNTRGEGALSIADLIARLRERDNMIFGNGYKDLAEHTFRIGHMGDHTPETVRRLLEAIDALL